MTGWIVRTIAPLAAIATLIGVPRCFGAVEHGNVAFDISPDGKRIVFSSADGDLYLFRPASQNVERLTSTKETESRPAFSPDGNSIVFGTSNKDDKSNLAVLALDQKRVRVVTKQEGASDTSPAFSRDGKRITFLRAHLLRPYSMGGMTWDGLDIYVVNEDGSNARRLTQRSYSRASSPHFSVDGKSVIYSGETNNYPAPSHPLLLEVAADGSKPPKSLGPDPPVGGTSGPKRIRMGSWANHPNISPDGLTVAFLSDRAKSFRYDLYLMKRDGTSVKPLAITEVSRYNSNPVFRPDGSGILFLAGTEWNASNRPIFSLWQVDVDGRNARRIADSGLFTDPLRWKPKP